MMVHRSATAQDLQIDQLVDRGRIAGTGGWILWAPAGFRPRFLRTSAPDSLEAGTLVVRVGDAPRRVTSALIRESYNFDCRRRPAIQALASASVAKPGISLLAHSGRDITTMYWPSF